MSFEELTSLRVVSGECSRTYEYPEGSVTIEGVIAEADDFYSSHCLITECGEKVIIKPGWLALRTSGANWPLVSTTSDTESADVELPSDPPSRWIM